MKHLKNTHCPVCNHIETMFLNEKENIYSCIACGFQSNDFSQNIISAWNNRTQTAHISKKNQRIYSINKSAQYYFQSTYKSNIQAMQYVKSRGFTEKDAEQFGFGFTRGGLTTFLLSQGYELEELIEAGLSTQQGKDFFFYRLTIPIKDNLGNIVGFGGRILYDGKPKYLNTSETPVFHKSSIFYGIHDFNWNSEYIILCEGYMDVITMHKYGFYETLAGMGTALTNNHCLLLKQFDKPIICVYDSDAAGQKAAEKNMLLLQKHGIVCHCIILQGAKDPDEYLQKYGAENLRALLQTQLTRSELLLQSEQISDLYRFCEIFSSTI